MNSKKKIDFKEQLEIINEEMIDDFKNILQLYIEKPYLDTIDFLKIQKDIKEICKNTFISYNKPDIAENLNVVIKVSLQKQTISVHPDDLFTALIFNNKYEDDLEFNDIKKIKSYKTKNGLSLQFSESDNSLYYVKTH